MKVIMKCVNIKLWEDVSCFHYILNAPRSNIPMKCQTIIVMHVDCMANYIKLVHAHFSETMKVGEN